MGWMELLKSDIDGNRKSEIIGDIEQDLVRLNKVTMRFQKSALYPNCARVA